MDYAFRGRRPNISESREAHQLLANVFGGTLRMRAVAANYIRLPDGMNSADYSKYTRGAPFSPFARQTVETWMGLIEGKPHLLAGTDSVQFKQEGLSYGIDHLIRNVLENVLAYGRIAIVCEPTGEIVTYLPEIAYQQHRVAKGWLVNHLSAALSSGELKISKNIIDYQNLRRELEDYQIGFSQSGQMTFNARDGQHDDAIISMSLAMYGTGQVKPGLTVSSLRW